MRLGCVNNLEKHHEQCTLQHTVRNLIYIDEPLYNIL
uniref:Uncharacterized protein n=1 Tax=Anguilla anguilla TaxID=7936 RepID=A0A0E9VVD5_ANGAN